MDDKNKKLRAAISGVIYYIEQEEKSQTDAQKQNSWSQMSRRMIMQNREWVQRRGKMFRLGRT